VNVYRQKPTHWKAVLQVVAAENLWVESVQPVAVRNTDASLQME
jgi:hypothetical protein